MKQIDQSTSPLLYFFDMFVDLTPSFSVFLGYNQNLKNYENIYSKEYNKQLDKIIQQTKQLLKSRSEPTLDRDLALWITRSHDLSKRFKTELMPLSSFNNYIFDFTLANKTMYSYTSVRDIKYLISRHEDMQCCIEDMIRNMHKGIQLGITIPRRICAKLISSLSMFIDQQHYFIDLDVSDQMKQSRVYKQYDVFIKTAYVASLQKLLMFLQKEYIRHCTQTVGICHLPNGKDMYRYLAKIQTTTNMDPSEIHKLGLAEVKRLTQLMHHVKSLLGYSKRASLQSFYKDMMTDDANFFKTKKDLISSYKAIKSQVRKTVIHNMFPGSVKDCDIKPVPSEMESTSAGAFYYPGSYDRKRMGRFYVNTRDLKENPKYGQYSLCLHEAEPGHHYQFQYMIDNNIPIHLIYAVPGTAFVEGWALYAETLGDYHLQTRENILHYFGKVTYEMFRAVRLVVDTGIHYYGWSFNKALRYMEKHLAMKKSELVTEVERYICIPGQALCYKIGELTFQRLKNDYIRAFGDSKKSLRNFHHLVLSNGVLPLEVLEKLVHDTIQPLSTRLING